MLAAEESGQFTYQSPQTSDDADNISSDKLDKEEGPNTPRSSPVQAAKVGLIDHWLRNVSPLVY